MTSWELPSDNLADVDPSPRDRTNVLYVAGTGRSGSTLVANAIGSLPGALSVGEVRFAFRRGLAEGGHCGCRRAVSHCPVWQPAFERTLKHPPTAEMATEVDRQLTELVRRRHLGWWLSGKTNPEAENMVDVHGRLLEGVAQTSGRSVLVDSSKLPTFCALLARSDRLSLKVLHLVRDPRAVAYSWQRQQATQAVQGFEEDMERIGSVKAASMWLHSTATVPRLSQRLGLETLTVRYEDFVANPAAIIASVSQFVGLSSDVSIAQPDGLHLTGSHAVAGNPSRVRTGPVALRPDDQWKKSMQVKDRRRVAILTRPVRSRYGY